MMQIFDDKYYIEKILRGDTSAFAVLVDKYKKMVFTIALRILKDREDAEETAQDTFLKAYNNLHEFKFDSGFSTWLYRITYNESISRVRRIKHETVEMNESYFDNNDFHINNEALSRLDAEDRKRFIDIALSLLDEDESLIVTLYYMNDSSVEEISSVTGLTKSNIKIKLFRARKKLLAELNKILHKEAETLL